MDTKSTINVLIVDDDLVFLEELKLLIEDDFSEMVDSVECATSVAKARSLLANNRYDLVFADIDFTDVGESKDAGLEILKFRDSWPELVVVLMTDKADRRIVFKGAKQGASGFLPKSPSFADDIAPVLAMACAQARRAKLVQRLALTVKSKNRLLAQYQKAILTAIQLILSVGTALASLYIAAPLVEGNFYRTVILIVVLLFSAVFFEFLKRFALKYKSFEMSADS